VGLLTDVGDGPLAVDTAPFIYFIEEHEVYFPIVAPLFQAVAEGRLRIVTSAITLLEVLVVPLRQGAQDIADRYERLLTKGRGIGLIDIDLDLIRGAAALRAVTRLKAPDSLQIAAAMRGHCRTILSNDRDWPHVPGLKLLQLRDYLPGTVSR
jgi:predicted nucleic acid-binding protein